MRKQAFDNPTGMLGSVPVIGPLLAGIGAEPENKDRAFLGSAAGQAAGATLLGGSAVAKNSLSSILRKMGKSPMSPASVKLRALLGAAMLGYYGAGNSGMDKQELELLRTSKARAKGTL